MDFSFQSQNGCITYNGLDATFHRVGANYICISYSEVDLEPFTLHESEFESLFLKSIHPRSNKQKSSSVYKELTHKQQDIIAWRKTCVKKLFEKVGNNKVGGKKFVKNSLHT